MNRFYIIAPIVCMLLFGGVYWNHSKHAAIEAKALEEQAALVKAEEAAKKEAAVVKAREDSAQRAAARLAEEAAAEADRREKWAAAGKKIADDTAANDKLIAQHIAAIKSFEAELIALRDAKEKANAKSLETTRNTELARIAKRNAEMEIQRMTEMVARKAAGTSLAAVP
jgi:hypothetical protein